MENRFKGRPYMDGKLQNHFVDRHPDAVVDIEFCVRDSNTKFIREKQTRQCHELFPFINIRRRTANMVEISSYVRVRGSKLVLLCVDTFRFEDQECVPLELMTNVVNRATDYFATISREYIITEDD